MITCFCNKGGSGVSTAAANLAISLRRLTSREVVEAHIEVLLRADLNAVVVDRFDDARAEAEAADARVAAGETGLPPFLGVPQRAHAHQQPQ